jgi:hypothetical protein
MSLFLIATIALVPACLLGILALTSCLEGWLEHDRPAGQPGQWPKPTSVSLLLQDKTPQSPNRLPLVEGPTIRLQRLAG